MMTKAQFIYESTKDNIARMIARADANATSADQNWQTETTVFTFKDGSKLEISGTEAKVL